MGNMFTTRFNHPADYSSADMASVEAFAEQMSTSHGCPTGPVSAQMAHVCESFYYQHYNHEKQANEYRLCRYFSQTGTCEHVGDTCIKELMEEDQKSPLQSGCVA